MSDVTKTQNATSSQTDSKDAYSHFLETSERIRKIAAQLPTYSGSSSCQNCAKLRAELERLRLADQKRLRLENRKLTDKTRLLASIKIEAQVSSSSDSD